MRLTKHYFLFLPLLACAAMLLSFTTQARQLPEFADLVEAYGPAVVNISTRANKPEKKSLGHPKQVPDELNDFFRHFFDEENKLGKPRPARSLGSGFIISKDGYIVTNHHVVEDSREIIVRLSDRREFEAELIGGDKRSDIALLKVKANDLPTVKIGSSKNVRVGEWVLAIGSPFGFEYSATVGIVSAKGRHLPNDNYVPFIQTDVAINPGNSGGPLFNLEGEVIGVNSQIYSRTGGFMGLSFAIPADMMKVILSQLKEKGQVSRGWLGVLIQDVTRELAESFEMGTPRGSLVAKVLPDSPAAKAGFKAGDIIVEFNGHTINRSAELPPVVGLTPVDSTAAARVIRNGKEVNLNVTIEELPTDAEVKATLKNNGKTVINKLLGISVRNIETKEREALDLAENGVLINDVVEDSPAFEAELRKGDVIMMLNREDVKDVVHFKELVAGIKVGHSIPVLIYRGGSPLFVALKIVKDE